MSKRVQHSEGNDDKELRILLEKFIRKSEELEKKESKVFKQVELVQSAVASLQAWKQVDSPPPPQRSPSPPPPLDIQKIEEETQEIREETKRIQKEVKEKIEANKRLQEEIERRNTLLSERFVTFREVPRGAKEIESRPAAAAPRQKLTYDPGIDFFKRRLDRLREMEKKVKAELKQESEEDRRKKKMLSEKIDKLEREANASGL